MDQKEYNRLQREFVASPFTLRLKPKMEKELLANAESEDFQESMQKYRALFGISTASEKNTLLQTTFFQHIIFDEYVRKPDENILESLEGTLRSFQHLAKPNEPSDRFSCIFNRKYLMCCSSLRAIHDKIFEDATFSQLLDFSTHGLEYALTAKACDKLIMRFPFNKIQLLLHSMDARPARVVLFLKAYDNADMTEEFLRLYNSTTLTEAQRMSLKRTLHSTEIFDAIFGSSVHHRFKILEREFEAFPHDSLRSFFECADTSVYQKEVKSLVLQSPLDIQLRLLEAFPEIDLSLREVFQHHQHSTDTGELFEPINTSPSCMKTLQVLLERLPEDMPQEQVDELFVRSTGLSTTLRVIFDVYSKPESAFLNKYTPIAFRNILQELVEDSSCVTRREAFEHFFPEIFHSLNTLEVFDEAPRNIRNGALELKVLKTLSRNENVTPQTNLLGKYLPPRYEHGNITSSQSKSLCALKDLDVTLSTCLLAIQSPTILKALETGVLTTASALEAIITQEQQPKTSKTRI